MGKPADKKSIQKNTKPAAKADRKVAKDCSAKAVSGKRKSYTGK